MKETLVAISGKAFMLGWGMVLIYVLLNSCGGLLIKMKVQGVGPCDTSAPKSILVYFIKILSQFKSWIGLCSVSLATCAWILALSQLELSKAYPVAIGLNLIVIVAVSIVQFQEVLNFSKIAGIILMFLGTLFLCLS